MTIRTGGAITRRQMLASAVGFGVLAMVQGGLATPIGDARAPLVAERSFRLARADDDSPIASLLTRVQRFGDEAAAIDAVTAVIANPLDLAEGEWIEVYVTDSVMVEAPVDPAPGVELSSLAFTTAAGAAGFVQQHVLAAMRRTGFVWRLEASGQDPALLSEVTFGLARVLSAREIGTFEVTRAADGLHDGGLWDLLPGARDVPGGLSEVEDKPADG